MKENAARAVFMRQGIAQGSMDAVAPETGVGKQIICRHFRSKEALVVAMCAPEVVEPPASSLPASAQLRELLLAFTDGVGGPDSIRAFTAPSSPRPIDAEARALVLEGGARDSSGPRSHNCGR